jgi:polar amino acid transport system permease protein
VNLLIGSLFSFSSWGGWLGQFLPGLVISLELTALMLAIGFPLGLMLALLTTAPQRWLRALIIAIVEVGRGIPALVLVYLAYYGLPHAGLTFTGFVAAVIAFSISIGAYSAEIFRGGLLGIPHSQLEAAQALGLPRAKQLRLVVLPQAMRISMPPLMGLAIQGFQITSLAYAVAVPELLNRAYNLGSVSFQFMGTLSLAAVIYAVITIAAARAVDWYERRMKSRAGFA